MQSVLARIFIIICSFAVGCQAPDQSRKGEESQEQTSKIKIAPRAIILFFGNSITAGYQLDMQQAFPALIQTRLDSMGYQYKTINAGLSGETSASGVRRIDWVLRDKPEIFVLELGANDGLRGLPLKETIINLQEIIDAVKALNQDVQIVIAGMQVPPNLGQEYTEQFNNIFKDLADNNQSVLIPFLLEGVAGDPDLNLSDGIHPTAEGHTILAETVWQSLLPVLKKPSAL
ncbi:MAG: acyl-CoA thioesterase-1 [Cyclobacteriaceae bacterium]|jgi:acyl-CoA thioesterase-1